MAKAQAAEIRRDPAFPDGSGAIIEGRLVKGDFARIRQFILDQGPIRVVYLASPGGDLAEAIKIGLLIRFLGIATVAPSKTLTSEEHAAAVLRHGLKDPPDYTCASACFFMFVAGVYRSADSHAPVILGIHRPTLVANGGQPSQDQIAAANALTRAAIESYLKDMDVPVPYVEDMYTSPKTTIRWIRNDEFARDFDGFTGKLRPAVSAACASFGEQTSTVEGKLPGQERGERAELGEQIPRRCERDFQAELANKAYRSAKAIRQEMTTPSYPSKGQPALQ
jgi:hypothetical protein